MTDRTEIACVIAEWWSLQNRKKKRGDSPFQLLDLVDTRITIETILKVDNVDPLVVSEDYSQIVVNGNTPGGTKIVQKFQSKMNFDDCMPVEKIKLKPVKVKDLNIRNCDFCRHEIIYKSGDAEGYTEEEKFNRDCNNFNVDAQNFFKKNCTLTMSKSEIPPVTDCPFWSKAKTIKNNSK